MREKIKHIWSWMKQHKKTMFVLFLVKLLLKIALLGWIVLSAGKCRAQSADKLLRQGNKFYKNEKYNNATESYSKALQKAPKDVRAHFNQGDALFRLNQLEKAKEHYLNAAKLSKNTDIQAKAFYNIGNAFYKQENYEEAAKAYKTSLKLNPKDEQAKYNLMMALSKLKKNGKGGKNSQDKKDQQDKKQDKNQQQKNQQGNNPQNRQQQGPQQSKPQQQQGQLTDEQAKKLLEAISNEEAKVQEKMGKEKGKPQTRKVQKDW
jgi:tetratricopeptide (TPR) repeat protein